MWNFLGILLIIAAFIIVGKLEFKENQVYQQHSKKTYGEYYGKNN
jgi:hypothetical protein